MARADPPTNPTTQPGSRRRRRVRRRRRRRVRLPLLVLGGVVGLVLGVGAIVSLGAASSAQNARDALERARAAATARDADGMRAALTDARDAFEDVRARASSPVVAPARVMPVVGTQLRTAAALGEVGRHLAEAGLAASDAIGTLPSDQVVFSGGRLDPAAAAALADALEAGLPSVRAARDAVARIPGGWVVGPLDTARTEATTTLPRVLDGIERATAAARGLPSFAGADGPRRYLLAFANPAEGRATGGFLGFFAVIDAADGRLRLGDAAGRPAAEFTQPGEGPPLSFPDWFPASLREQAALWQNVNLTSDFPAAAGLMVQGASRDLGPLDGVIQVDPSAIAALLTHVGSLTVDGWPDPITADNVEAVATRDVYARLGGDREREEAFFRDLIDQTMGRFLAADVRVSLDALGPLDAAVRGGHLRAFSRHASDQDAIVAMGLHGGLDRTAGATDVVGLVTQNASGNKADVYLRRSLRYEVRLDPDTNSATTTLSVKLRDERPADVPARVAAPLGGQPADRTTHTLTVLRPSGVAASEARLEGAPVSPVTWREASLEAHTTRAVVPAGRDVELVTQAVVDGALTGTGRHRTYRLHVLRQPTSHPDFVEVQLSAPPGWTIQGASEVIGDVEEDLVVEVTLRETTLAWAARALLLDPASAVVRWVRVTG